MRSVDFSESQLGQTSGTQRTVNDRRHWVMFEERDVRVDVFALGLLVLVVFLSCALLSYDPADPVLELVYTLNQLYQPDRGDRCELLDESTAV